MGEVVSCFGGGNDALASRAREFPFDESAISIPIGARGQAEALLQAESRG